MGANKSMITFLLVYAGFLTLVIVGGIHYYEDKLKDYKLSISDYKRALNLSRSYSNADHYTQLQLDNSALQKQVRVLKAQLAGDSQGIQYESSIYKSNTWESSLDNFIQEDIDFDQ